MPPSDLFALLNTCHPVSRETFDRLHVYCDLLLRWQKKINLISNDTIEDIWSRHFLDSLQLANHIPSNTTILDLGSGAGFSGLLLAALGHHMHLVESDRKKITFLQEAARLMNVAVTLHHTRIEQCPAIDANIICARALADLTQLLFYCENHVSRETTCLFPKGKNYAKEIDDALSKWSFDYEVIPSITSPDGVVLKLSHIRKRAAHDTYSIDR